MGISISYCEFDILSLNANFNDLLVAIEQKSIMGEQIIIEKSLKV
jgi:hypothetical protein